jgi:hypothetical protein
MLHQENLSWSNPLTTKPRRTKAENLAIIAEKANRLADASPLAFTLVSGEHVTALTVNGEQLPLWPATVRGVPNLVLRSALFGTVQRGARAYQTAVKKASVDNVTVMHTGPQLDQADLDVWEQCLHLARVGGLGTRIEFTSGSFLTAIGRGKGKSQYEWLKGALRRLMTSLVELEDGKKAYAGQLIHHWSRDEVTGLNILEINPALSRLYGTDGWTGVQVDERRFLKKQPLAQWLHGFYSTHARPYALKVETIHRLCGSESKLMYSFRRELSEALVSLSEATGWECRIDEKDLVQIKRSLK